jgi:hypothetical protein
MEFKVRLKKIHNAWNGMYKNEFTVGDELIIKDGLITSKNGREFSIKELAKSFSNKGLYNELFEKV